MNFANSSITNRLVTILDFLEGVPPEESIHILSGEWGVETYREGDVIFEQGSEARYTYFIINGQVSWKRQKPATSLGKPSLGYVVGERALLGHFALLYNVPHVRTAKANRHCELLRLDNRVLNRLLYRFSHVRDQMMNISAIKRLRSIPWLAELDMIDISLLAEIAIRRHFQTEEIVYSRHQVGGKNFFIIDQGQVDLSYGREGTVRFLGNGTVFGIYSTLTGKGYRNTATVRCPSEIYVLPHEILNQAAPYFPGMSVGDHYEARLETVQKVQLFSKLDIDEISRLVGYASHIHFPQSHLISFQSESAHALWMLLPQSTATLHVIGSDGEALPRKNITGPAYFGEAALLMEAPIVSTIEANPESEWLKLDRQDFLAFDQQEKGRILPKLNPSPKTLKRRKQATKRKKVSWLPSDEVLLLYEHRHWLIFLRKLLPGLSLASVSLVLLFLSWVLKSDVSIPLTILSVGVIILAVFAGSWGWVDYRNDFIFVTNKRVVQQEKMLFFYEIRRDIPLYQIQDIVIKKGLLGNFLGYGDMIIQTASKDGRISFDYAPTTVDMRGLISYQIQAQRNNLQAQDKVRIQDLLETRFGIKLTLPNRVLVPLSEEPSTSERLKGTSISVWRQHWIILVSKLIIPIVFFVLSFVISLGEFLDIARVSREVFGAFELIAAVMGLVALSSGAWIFADWRNDTYELTDNIIVDVSKLPLFFAENRRQASLSEIQDVQYEMPSFFHNILKFGNVRISTAATDSIFTFDSVPNPAGVVNEIRRRIEKWRFLDEANRAKKRAEELPDWFEIYKRLDSNG